jgi:hypothetical protein
VENSKLDVQINLYNNNSHSVEKSPYSQLGKAGIMGQKICFKLERKMSREGLKNWEEGRNDLNELAPSPQYLVF